MDDGPFSSRLRTMAATSNASLLLRAVVMVGWSLSCATLSVAFVVVPQLATLCPSSPTCQTRSVTTLNLFGSGGGAPKVPRKASEKNQQVVQAVKAALSSPRTPSFRLIECDFPPVDSRNMQGDGSLRSATVVEDANLATAKLLLQSLSPLVPGLGPAVWLVTSTGASMTLQRKASTIGKSFAHSLKNGLPPVKSRDVCILVAPCTSADYAYAKQLAFNGNAVVLVNGIAKDTKSVSGDATMAYFLKPLTYNSQIAGYLIRIYPGPWTVVDAATTKNVVLGTFTDRDVLVSGTNTPDLRAAGRLVQKAVDERAIRARQR